METDLSPLIENQVKLVAKIQNMALIDLTEKTSEMLDLHLGLLFELLDNTEIFWDDEDGDEDSEVDKTPTPLPQDAKY